MKKKRLAYLLSAFILATHVCPQESQAKEEYEVELDCEDYESVILDSEFSVKCSNGNEYDMVWYKGSRYYNFQDTKTKENIWEDVQYTVHDIVTFDFTTYLIVWDNNGYGLFNLNTKSFEEKCGTYTFMHPLGDKDSRYLIIRFHDGAGLYDLKEKKEKISCGTYENVSPVYLESYFGIDNKGQFALWDSDTMSEIIPFGVYDGVFREYSFENKLYSIVYKEIDEVVYFGLLDLETLEEVIPCEQREIQADYDERHQIIGFTATDFYSNQLQYTTFINAKRDRRYMCSQSLV